MIIKVRHLKSNTRHAILGRMYRGLYDHIDISLFNPELFERIPESPSDIGVSARCPKTGRARSKELREKIRVERFKEWQKKHQKEYDKENKLALERKNRG